MSEESKNDRLVEIQERYRDTVVFPSRVYEVQANDLAWLIQEVEQLKGRNETQSDSIMEFQEEQRAFRAALQEAAIEAHVGFQHPRQWEDCDLNSCCERKRLIGGREINEDPED